MSRGTSAGNRLQTRESAFAFACFVVWLVAAASAPALGIWLAIGGAAVVLGSAVLAFEGSASHALLRPTPRLLLIGVAAGGAMAAATYLLYPAMSSIAPFIASDTRRLYTAFRAPSLAVASLALAPVILGEELVWRSVVQSALTRSAGLVRGVVLTAIAYALAHAPLGSPLLVLVALACGLCWGALRAVTGSLVPALTAHLSWDVLVMLLLPLD